MSQDFSNQNLIGRSFKGKNLAYADFRNADIRSAVFTNATLKGANFSHAKAGQRYGWLSLITVSSLGLAALAGLISAYAGGLVGHLMLITDKSDIFDSPETFWGSSVAALIALSIFIYIVVRRGLGAASGIFALIVAVMIAVIAAAGEAEAVVAAMIQSIVLAIAISGAVVTAIAVATVWMLAGKLSVAAVITAALLAAIPGALEGAELEKLTASSGFVALGIAGTVAISLLGLGIYIGWRAVIGDPKYSIIGTIATTLSSLGGTSFRGANLTDANFTEAILKSADLRRAILTRTCWFQAQGLNCARVDGTYLENHQIQQLALNKYSQDQIFDYLDLQGLNLKNANLQNFSFIGTNLSEATLEKADLSGAKLVKAQLYQADFTEACLTGAYIQDWGISTDTKLSGIRCKYIYMRLPTADDPDACRKPDNRHEDFKEGDFSDFITPIIKTLDLYRTQDVDPRTIADAFKTIDLFHSEGIDPSAAAVTLQQITERYPEAKLEVVALEGRGREKVRLQAKVTDVVDRSAISEEYFQTYNQLKALSYSDIQALLRGIKEKDERIFSLENLLKNALQQPRFYVETYSNQGEFIVTQSKGNISISEVQGNVSGVTAAGEDLTMTGAALGEISGAVTNTINQLPPSLDPEKLGIKELLAELQKAIEAEPELPPADKAEALEQVKILAEASQQPEDNTLQKTAKTAMKILKGTAASLSETTKLVEACAKLFPAISSLLLLL